MAANAVPLAVTASSHSAVYALIAVICGPATGWVHEKSE